MSTFAPHSAVDKAGYGCMPGDQLPEPMQIVFSNYDSPPNPYYGGGGAVAIHEVAKRLAGRNSVTVVTGRFRKVKDALREGVNYKHLGLAAAGPKLGQLIYQFLLPWRLWREHFDIWVESLTPPFSTACLPLFTRKPVVALTQVLAGKAMARKYKLPFAVVERTGLRCYRYGIALSEYLKGELLGANPNMQVRVIPNGIAHEQIVKPIHKEETHILFLGRIDREQKGLDLLLDALGTLGDRLAVPVVIAGSGASDEEAFVASRIRELGLSRRVKAVGRVAGAQKEELLSKALFLVMPSRFEASPLVLAEAFCYELPVVMFAIPELLELPDDCCVKVPPFNCQALGSAIKALVEDSPRRHAMGLAAKQFARGFDWDDLAARYEKFLGQIVLDPTYRT